MVFGWQLEIEHRIWLTHKIAWARMKNDFGFNTSTANTKPERGSFLCCIMHGHDNLSKLEMGKTIQFPFSSSAKHTWTYNCNHKPHIVWHKVSRSDIFQYFCGISFVCLVNAWFESLNMTAKHRLPVGDGCINNHAMRNVLLFRGYDVQMYENQKHICHTIHGFIYSFHHFVAVNIKLCHVFHFVDVCFE